MSAELAARRTAAAAVLGDYDRALRATNDARDVRWSYWAQRLGAEVRSLLTQLDIEKPQPDPAAGQLAQIRLVLNAFDWEHDDRQYALEQIDDIVRSAQ